MLIGKSLGWLGQANCFTQLAFINAYHWRRIKKSDKWKTAFKIQYNHFEYQVMFFGLLNAPASLQGYINKILAKKLNIFRIVYRDNVLSYTQGESQANINIIWWVLKKPRKYSLFANLK